MIRKLALLGDLHCGPGNYKNLSKALDMVAGVVLSEGCDYLVQLGDIWDHYNISTSQVSVATIVSAAETPLFKMADNGVKIIIIEGNHDKSIRGTQGIFHRSSITLIKHDNITTVSEPSLISFDNSLFQCLPWSTDDERETIKELTEKWNKWNKDKFKVLVGHFLLEGSTQNGYEVSSGDFKISQEELKSFEFKIVAAGHIHHRQLIYPGLIMQNDLRDAGAPTGFRIVEYDDEGEVLSDRFIDIKTPQYFLLEMNSSNPEDIAAFIRDKVNNDFHHYVVRVHSKKQGNVPTPPNVKLEYKPIIETISRIGVERERVAQMSYREMLRFWGERMNYKEEEIKVGEEIMKEMEIK